jgi:hypothetical protein
MPTNFTRLPILSSNRNNAGYQPPLTTAVLNNRGDIPLKQRRRFTFKNIWIWHLFLKIWKRYIKNDKIGILVLKLCAKGQLRPSTFKTANLVPQLSFLGQTLSYTNMWLHIGMKLIQKVHFTLGSHLFYFHLYNFKIMYNRKWIWGYICLPTNYEYIHGACITYHEYVSTCWF